MSNERGAGRKPQDIKKDRVIFYIWSNKAEAFKKEVQPIADRHNGAEKVIEAVTFAENAKGKKGVKAKPISMKKFNQAVDEFVEMVTHPLYKKGDPKENTGAFFLKYGVSTYAELANKK